MEKPQTYPQQVFAGLGKFAVAAGLILLVLGVAAAVRAPFYDFGGWAGLGDGRLVGGMGAAVLAAAFLVPLFNAENRRARGL